MIRKDDPVTWIAASAATAIIGFLLIDHYSMQLSANIMRGEIGGFPYRYVLIGAVVMLLRAAYLWRQKTK